MRMIANRRTARPIMFVPWLFCYALLVAAQGCAATTEQKTDGPTIYLPGNGHARAQMVPAAVGNSATYRYLLDDLAEPTRVGLAINDQQTYSVWVKPNHGRAVVEYRRDTNELVQLTGSWHQFSFTPDNNDKDIQTVHLAGSFNGWSTDAMPMTKRGDGTYVALMRLPEGVHWYKFVVNGDTWLNDPASDKEFEQPDGNYGINSAVLVGVDARGLPKPKPNHIEASAVIHDPNDVPDLAVASRTLLRLSLRVQQDDIEQAHVLIQSTDDQANWQRFQLQPSGEAVGFRRYGALIELGGQPVRYVFELIDGNATRFRSSSGLPDSLVDAKSYAYQCDMEPTYVTPDWAKSAVWYQVFPERFRNGDTSNDPPNTMPWRSDWWATQPGEAAGDENFYTGQGNVWRRRYGGDIQGLTNKLPYLRSLGINAIYLNPVFEARSMHKYDTSDFRHIDDNFGVKGDIEQLTGETDDPATWQWSKSDQVFLDFIKEAHRQGFKVVIDGVFNHVGEGHYAFQDVLKNGRDSKYAGWFDIIDWGTGGEPGKPGGIQWRGWDDDNGQLPLLKKDPVHGLAKGPREHIFAITKRWMAPNGDPNAGVDGWRLDVAPDIPHPFWIQWRKLVKDINPDALIVGEIWTWAQPWLQGDQFDSSMNYQFAIPAQDFFADQDTALSPSEFSASLNHLVYAYPLQSALVMQNMIDSHDTDRLASMFVNPDRGYDTGNRLQDTGPDYDKSKPNQTQRKRMMQALVCQMTFVGAPMIYYGTEAGMWSPDDPSNRQPMIWQDLLPYDDPQITFDQGLFRWYQRLIAARQALPPLHRGFFRTLIANDDAGVLAYARGLGDQQVYIVLNRSDKPATVTLPVAQADLGQKLINWLNNDHAHLLPENTDNPQARPTLKPSGKRNNSLISDAKGTVTLRLGAYESAVLSRPSLPLP